MRFVIGGRQSGKTTRILYTADTMGYPIVVSTSKRKEIISDLAKKLNLSNVDVVTYMEYEMYRAGKYAEKVLIDDAENIVEKCLERYFHCKIGAVTLTNEL